MVHRADLRLVAPRAPTGPNMILDDGGDATLLVHKGREFELAGAVPETRGRATATSGASSSTCCAARSRTSPDRWTDRSPPASRASPRRPRPACTASTSSHKRGRAALPGDQRQRLGHQVEVRQQVRHPPLAARRPQPRHRRADRRQGRVRRRLRRRRQGRRPRRCAARAPASSSARSTRSTRSRRRWTATRSPASRACSTEVDIFVTATGNENVITRRAPAGHEAQGDRRERRPLRQRDRHGRAREARRRRAGRDQAAGARVAPAERPQRAGALARAG